MLYGVEIINLLKGETATLDKYQNQVFKTLLGLPKSASSAAVNLLTGLAPLSTSVDLAHLRLLGKLLVLPLSRVESRLFHHTLCQHPNAPTLKRLKTTLEKYNLPDLTECCSEAYTYQAWKKKITIAASEFVAASTSRYIQEQSSLSLFVGVNPAHFKDLYPSVIDPPRLREAISIKAQLLTHTYLTRSRLCKITKDVSDPLCTACNSAIETVEHIIGECTMYSDERRKVLSYFSADVRNDLNRLPPSQTAFYITRLILLGISGQNKLDSKDFYMTTFQYLTDIHHKRLNC